MNVSLGSFERGPIYVTRVSLPPTALDHRCAGSLVCDLQVCSSARDRAMAQVLPDVLDSRLFDRLHRN